jgi:hypothetical protein
LPVPYSQYGATDRVTNCGLQLYQKASYVLHTNFCWTIWLLHLRPWPRTKIIYLEGVICVYMSCRCIATNELHKNQIAKSDYLLSHQYSETNVMHISFNLLIIKGRYMFRALLAHPQEALHKRHLLYSVHIMSVGCGGTVAVQLQPCNVATKLQSILYIFVFTWRWRSWPKYVTNKYWKYVWNLKLTYKYI